MAECCVIAGVGRSRHCMDANAGNRAEGNNRRINWRIFYAPHFQSVEEGDIDADVYGSKHYSDGEAESNTEDLHQYWP